MQVGVVSMGDALRAVICGEKHAADLPTELDVADNPEVPVGQWPISVLTVLLLCAHCALALCSCSVLLLCAASPCVHVLHLSIRSFCPINQELLPS